MHTSRAPVSRSAVIRREQEQTSNPTYCQPADSGVTVRMVPSLGGGRPENEQLTHAAPGGLR